MDPQLRKLASRQADVVAAWQLRRIGWSWNRIRHQRHRGGWRTIHAGVYLLASSPISRRQLWFAAVLTAPDTFLSHGSAGACYGVHRFGRGYEVVTRRGRGGRRRRHGVLVFRSSALDGDLTHHEGIPITTAARVLVDLAAGLDDKRLGRAFRESIRLRHTHAGQVLLTTERRHPQPGTPALAALATRYAHIPYQRTRSDAEGRALEILHDAGFTPPRVNIRVAGYEADLVWTEGGLIVEIDGPRYHRFRDEDLRKAEAWRRAGYTVRRIASDVVYSDPLALLALCG
jgi:very-short-patch-repair endonuclease